MSLLHTRYQTKNGWGTIVHIYVNGSFEVELDDNNETITVEKPLNNDYLEQTHFLPIKNYSNVRCLNGSAHIKRSTDINDVTCPLCLNEETHKSFWKEKENDGRYINPLTK
jgi:hypothetical protein